MVDKASTKLFAKPEERINVHGFGGSKTARAAEAKLMAAAYGTRRRSRPFSHADSLAK